MPPDADDDKTVHDSQVGDESLIREAIPPPASLVGQRFGPYRIIREIGRGGMGTVYLASRADDQFKKLVALKLLLGQVNAEEILRRFRYERQILATLNHPNIATLFDGGSAPGGEPYFVMEYVEGTPLDDYCDAHNLSIPERLALFRQVCSAVQYVHQHLIVHRDLKPNNILVTKDGVPKLLDFGIAKILKPELMMSVIYATNADARMMTPAYASPEQVRGDPITTASDVYSLGVILYELLTGRRPYRLKSSSLHELSRAICEDEMEKPSTAITREDKKNTPQASVTAEQLSRKRATLPDKLQRLLQGDLDNILLKAMRKEPQRRYGSVEQLSGDVDRHLKRLPVSAHEDSLGYRTTKFIQRHKVSVIAGGIAVFSLIAGLITTIVEARVALAERALAESRFQDVRKLATTFLFDVHDSIQNLAGSTPARSLIAKTGAEYLDRLANESRGDTSLQQEVANGYVKIGDVEGNPYGANLGDTKKAIGSYRKAIAMGRTLVSRDPKDKKSKAVLALALYQISGVLPFDGKTAEALGLSAEALRVYEQILLQEPENPEAKLDVGRAIEQQGDILGGAQSINLGRKPEAAAAYRRSLDLIPHLPPTHPLAARAARGRIILSLKVAGIQPGNRNRTDTLDRYKDALRMAEEAARNSPHDLRARELLSMVLSSIAFTQQNFGDTKSALETYGKAVEIDEASLKADPNNAGAQQRAAGTHKNFGDVYFYQMRKMPDALNHYRRAAELMEMETRADPNNVVGLQRLSEVLTCVASCLLATGQKEEARRQALRGLEIAKELADRPNATHDQIYNYAWLAVTVEPGELQEPAKALPYALKAVKMGTGPDEYATHVLAQAYAGSGDYAHAVETEEKLLATFPQGAGTVKTAMQQIVEGALKEYREQLKAQAKPK